MRFNVGGRTVRRPARVADPGARSGEVTRFELRSEFGREAFEAAFLPSDREAVLPEHGDAGGVVAAVLEDAQTFEQGFDDRAFLQQCSDDPAHPRRLPAQVRSGAETLATRSRK